MSEQNCKTIDEYIAQYDGQVKDILEKTKEAIRAAAPEAIEKISYGMPCFWQREPLIYFGAMKHHLGVYPTGSGMEALREKLTAYKTSKGAVQFPYKTPIPYDLIAEITRFRVKQTKEKRK